MNSTGLLSHQKRIHATTSIFKGLSKKVPSFYQKLPESELSDYIDAFLIYLQKYISSKNYLLFLVDPYLFLVRIVNFIKPKFSLRN